MIKNLTPSASRLLLAMLTSDPSEDQDDMIRRAGIRQYSTYLQAKSMLTEVGFITTDQEGKRSISLVPARVSHQKF